MLGHVLLSKERLLLVPDLLVRSTHSSGDQIDDVY